MRPPAGIVGRAAAEDRRALRYALALAATAVACAVAWSLRSHLAPAVFAPFFGGVALSVWFGGAGPGLLSTATGALLSAFLLIEPRYTFAVRGDDLYRWIVAVLVALLIVLLGQSLHRSRRRAERKEEAVTRLQQLTSTLAAARTEDDVLEVAVGKVERVAGASGVIAGTLLPDGQLRIVRRTGVAGSAAAVMPSVIPVDDSGSALAAATRSNEEVWLLTRSELDRCYPRVAHAYPHATAACALPLRIGGRAVGALGVVLEGHRKLDAELQGLLMSVTSQCSLALDRVRLYEQQRAIATTLQEGLLPAALPIVPGIDLASAYVPAESAHDVGGDFYDVFRTANGLLLVVGDVCGKGPKAARLTDLCRNTIRAVALENDAPGHLLAQLDRVLLQRQLDKTEHASVSCTLVHMAEGRLLATAASAGHPPLLHLRAGTVTEVKPAGSPVGAFERAAFAEETIELRAGDLLVAYTDGVTDARRDGELFGEQRLRVVLAGESTRAQAVIGAVGAALDAFMEGGRYADDVALLALGVEALPDPALLRDPGMVTPV